MEAEFSLIYPMKPKEKILKNQHINQKLHKATLFSKENQGSSDFLGDGVWWAKALFKCSFFNANIVFTLLTATFEKLTYFSEN